MVLGRFSQRRSAGFTFIELLLVVAIVAIVFGLLGAGINKVRRAADQAKSLDNLRALSRACNDLNSQWKKLPPGVGTFPSMKGPTGTVFYWILPFLGKNIGENSEFFVAPGDFSLPANNILKNGLEACSYAGNGYVFSGDSGDMRVDLPPLCYTYPSAKIPTTFTDGTSNTILFMEKYATCSLVNNPREGYEENGRGEHGWADNTLLAKNIGTNGYYSNFTPIQLSLAAPQFQPDLLDADCKLPQGFSSKSIAVAMADGSTRLVSFRVTSRTWSLLLLPNDSKPEPKDWK
jgi:prepilin-type N-terminal cleavage/methylation domain-containing protein